VHVLVALGATVFTGAGVYGVAGLGTVQDAGRVAAQAVVGVGFLGAGTIWRSRDDRVIYGLTTAARIWLAAGLGMLAAYGLYALAGRGRCSASPRCGR
jgi:putative Mg2+ transporter-C (MgtC) family protein